MQWVGLTHKESDKLRAVKGCTIRKFELVGVLSQDTVGNVTNVQSKFRSVMTPISVIAVSQSFAASFKQHFYRRPKGYKKQNANIK